MQILLENFILALFLVYYDKFRHNAKPSQISTLWNFVLLGSVHAHRFDSIFFFTNMTLIDWQI